MSIKPQKEKSVINGYLELHIEKNKKDMSKYMNLSLKPYLASTNILYVDTITQPHSQNIHWRPIKKIRIEVILQSRCIHNLYIKSKNQVTTNTYTITQQ